MDTDWLHSTAARQRGLVAVRQATRRGIPAETLRTHLQRRGWTSITPKVWLAPGAPTPPDIQVRAAALHLGPPVAVARWSAAAVHGLHRSVPLAQVLVPAGRRACRLPRIQTLRTRTWSDADVVEVAGVPVTTMARTVCDLAAVADLDALRSLVIDARQRRRLDLADLVKQLAIAGRLRGRQQVERILRELDEDLVDSEFERLALGWLRSEGYPVVSQHPLEASGRTVHLDLALPSHRIAIECLGFGGHSERRHLDVDALRNNAITANHWRPLELTWQQFTRQRQTFLEALVGAMGEAP